MSSERSSGGMGITGVLTVVFVTLKLLEVAPVASWGWLWVLSPVWIGFTLVFLLMLFASLFE